ncbi:MAG: glycosyltransferase family 2 protein [candidate division WOR-3 bacterium]|nr:glycosyltransferase family 2 protein [candidate division WOR-3 bacterium]
MSTDQRDPVISVVTPAFNEESCLPLLYDRLCAVFDASSSARSGVGRCNWEWVVVDDHSRDQSFSVVSGIARRDARARCLRLARNSGSHTAVLCGMHHARGDCAVVMAADLQDPPETIPLLIDKWKAGADVVWAVREERLGESRQTLLFARLYYWLMRRVVGLQSIPEHGADFFLIDRKVIDAVGRFTETNTSIMALLNWMGFKQDSVSYVKQGRTHGRSGWTLAKKVKLLLDSVTSFSFLPIRIMSFAGFCLALLGFLYALVVIVNAILRRPVQGYPSLMVAVLVIGGMQMLMMGVLGEYLWRTLDESRRRPRFLIEETTEKGDGAERPSEEENLHGKP